MNIKRVAAFAFSMALGLPLGAVCAQGNEPIKLVVAFPPGGPADTLARILSNNLGRELNRTIVVENHPGASGVIAARYVINSPTPNDTLFISNGGVLVINPAITPNLSYDASRDFKPVTMVADTTTVMVTSATSQVKDIADLKAKLAANPHGFSAGSSGVGAASHLSIEMFDEGSHAELLHVPYKGASPAIADVIGGRIDFFFGDLPGVIGMIQGGKLKALGVAADKRSPLLPGVPTLAEQGVQGVLPSGWYGVVMPAAASDEAVQRYAKAIIAVMSDAKVQHQLSEMGATVDASGSAAFKAFLDADRPRWQDLAKRRNIQAAN